MGTIRTLVLGLLAGSAATAAKTKAEQLLQPVGERLLPPAPSAKAGLGADPAGHPENMPPSEVVDRVQHAVTGRELTDEQRRQVSTSVHWAMGLGFGAAYALAAAHQPRVRAGAGTVAATGLFLATHASTLPAAGVQHPLSRLPRAWWVWEGGSHLVYGIVLDTGLRVLQRSQSTRNGREPNSTQT